MLGVDQFVVTLPDGSTGVLSFTTPVAGNLASKLVLSFDLRHAASINAGSPVLGDSIAVLKDLSQSGNDASQSQVANAFSYDPAAINGKPGMVGDGASRWLSLLQSVGVVCPFTMFVVFQPGNDPANATILISSPDPLVNPQIGIGSFPDGAGGYQVSTFLQDNSVGGRAGIQWGLVLTPGKPTIICITSDVNDQSAVAYQDNKQVGDLVYYPWPNQSWDFQSDATNFGGVGARCLNGAIGAFRLYNDVLSPGDRTKVFKELKSGFGL